MSTLRNKTILIFIFKDLKIGIFELCVLLEQPNLKGYSNFKKFNIKETNLHLKIQYF